MNGVQEMKDCLFLLLGTTRSKDATGSKGHRYERSKDATRAARVFGAPGDLRSEILHNASAICLVAHRFGRHLLASLGLNISSRQSLQWSISNLAFFEAANEGKRQLVNDATMDRANFKVPRVSSKFENAGERAAMRTVLELPLKDSCLGSPTFECRSWRRSDGFIDVFFVSELQDVGEL